MAITEYGLLVALVSLLLIGVVMIYGRDIKSWVNARIGAFTSPDSASIGLPKG